MPHQKVCPFNVHICAIRNNGGPSLMTFPEYIQGDKLLSMLGELSNASPFFIKHYFYFLCGFNPRVRINKTEAASSQFQNAKGLPITFTGKNQTTKPEEVDLRKWAPSDVTELVEPSASVESTTGNSAMGVPCSTPKYRTLSFSLMFKISSYLKIASLFVLMVMWRLPFTKAHEWAEPIFASEFCTLQVLLFYHRLVMLNSSRTTLVRARWRGLR